MDNYCRICFNKITDYSLYNLINKKNILCEECFNKFKAKFHKFSLDGINGLAIYDYDENMKNLIYKFKGCYDYELNDVFLARYLPYLKFMYHGYVVVPAPSYYLDDEKRGFNHVVEIFKNLKLKMLPIIHKTKPHKQSEHSAKGRLDITHILSIDKNVNLKDKNILLVDDIMTTGSTLFSCVELLKKLHPKKIEILVVAKTKKKPKNEYWLFCISKN